MCSSGNRRSGQPAEFGGEHRHGAYERLGVLKANKHCDALSGSTHKRSVGELPWATTKDSPRFALTLATRPEQPERAGPAFGRPPSKSTGDQRETNAGHREDWQARHPAGPSADGRLPQRAAPVDRFQERGADRLQRSLNTIPAAGQRPSGSECGDVRNRNDLTPYLTIGRRAGSR
jgi:hypothetical protein